IRATISRDLHPVEDIRGFFPFAVLLVLLIILTVFGLETMHYLPKFGTSMSRVAEYYLAHGLVETGAANIVSAIILDYRGYDTLGEATVLFTAVVGAVAILRRKAKQDG
ncbi:MAG TPA: hydrogen gas-evolving membrane-bound hydrogenase subunit E, partial [bacterium]|nr:hydrogen gas-evolving membrane-bound hydrogenase subunit E [bacterium]